LKSEQTWSNWNVISDTEKANVVFVVTRNQSTYLQIIQPGGPDFNTDEAEEVTKEIRTIIKERKMIQDILNKYG